MHKIRRRKTNGINLLINGAYTNVEIDNLCLRFIPTNANKAEFARLAVLEVWRDFYANGAPDVTFSEAILAIKDASGASIASIVQLSIAYVGGAIVREIE